MRLRLHVALALILCLLGLIPSARGYSVLTHEQLIDLTWDTSIVPLLLSRYPSLTPVELEHADRSKRERDPGRPDHAADREGGAVGGGLQRVHDRQLFDDRDDLHGDVGNRFISDLVLSRRVHANERLDAPVGDRVLFTRGGSFRWHDHILEGKTSLLTNAEVLDAGIVDEEEDYFND